MEMEGGSRGRRVVRIVSVRRRSPMTRIPKEPGMGGRGGGAGTRAVVDASGEEVEVEDEGVGLGLGGRGESVKELEGARSRPVEVKGVVREREK